MLPAACEGNGAVCQGSAASVVLVAVVTGFCDMSPGPLTTSLKLLMLSMLELKRN